MIKDFKYIIKRILIGVGIILFMTFIKSCQVHAKIYPYIDTGGTIYYNPSGNDITNTRMNTLYYKSTQANPASIKTIGYVIDNNIRDINSGTYLIDLYIYGVGNFYSNYRADDFTTNVCWWNATDGTQHCESSYSKSSIIEVRKDTYSGYDAIHILMRWQVSDPYDGGVGQVSIQVTKYNLFTMLSTGTNTGYAISGVYDYDIQYIENWKNNSLLSSIDSSINNQTQTQHQDSLNEQNSINGITDAINDSSIPVDSSNQINAITSAINNNQNSSIVQIATFIPQTLQVILNGFQTNCTGGYSLGSLYGTELTIPCINPVDYLGSFLWGVIDSILCLCYLIPLCKFLVNKYNDLTSMKNLRWQ